MFKRFRKTFARSVNMRMLILSVLFVIFAFILMRRLFDLQIVNGESYLTDFTMQIRRETSIPSTRGCIYDSDGKLIAFNKLTYDVTFQDMGNYASSAERNLVINGYLYKIMQILYANGDDVYTDFAVETDDAGQYAFTRRGYNLLRFKADVYGRAYTEAPDGVDPSDMSVLQPEEAAVTPDELIAELGSDNWYGVLVRRTPEEWKELGISEEQAAEYGLPEDISQEDCLKLIALRSAINQNSYQKYVSTTIAKDISKRSMSSLMESKGYYVGVDVVESSIRMYNESPYYSNIIGYTGQISAEEIESLNDEMGRDVYDMTDIVGKVGLEQYFETQLQGMDGKKVVYVDNLGKVLKEDSVVEPQAGNDLYLTIKTDYQKAAYHLLEQYIAGIIYKYTLDLKEIDNENVNEDEIRIPVYDLYYALIENNVLSVSHMESADATALEREVFGMLQAREAQIFSDLKGELLSETPRPYSELSKAMKVYMTYLVDTTLPELGILKTDAIDRTDETYIAWAVDETISLREYLTYAISKDWLDVTGIMEESDFWNSDEIFTNLCDYLEEYVKDDDNFSKKVYKYMVEDDTLNPSVLCRLLFDQGILEMNEADYQGLADGSQDAYSFIMSKLYNLEIPPSKFAVAPCSGSLVLVDPNNGNVLACVTYPGYDNNRLANDMDEDYFEELISDGSSPFYNKATQELTAPGSTYKMVTSVAGVMEGVVGVTEAIGCTGKFDAVFPEINCWIYPGAHGAITLSTALQESCNYYFNTIGFRLGDVGDPDGEHDDATGVAKLAKYASMFGFDQETGIEMDESTPHISDNAMAPSAMGQGRNAYATVQLARYVATVANSGTCYDLTLLDKITDPEGRTVVQQEPVVHSYVDASDYLWTAIHTGMNQMVQMNMYMKDVGINMAGKTGTAEETGVPSHALFVGYAPYEAPEIAIACRITNGYTSANAALLARDMIRYIFNLQKPDELITGHASVYEGTISGARTD